LTVGLTPESGREMPAHRPDGPESRLAALGLELPPAPVPLGQYAPLVNAAGLVFLSGMVPLISGKPEYVGVIGSSLTVAEAARAARLAALNAVSVLRAGTGSLDAIAGIVRLSVNLRTIADFTEHPKVADAASAVFNEVFGGRHTRMVFGVLSLPAGMCLELEVIAQLVG